MCSFLLINPHCCRPDKYSPGSKVHTHPKVQTGASFLCGICLSVKSSAWMWREPRKLGAVSATQIPSGFRKPIASSALLLPYFPQPVAKCEDRERLTLLHIPHLQSECLSSPPHMAGRRKNSQAFPRSRPSSSSLLGWKTQVFSLILWKAQVLGALSQDRPFPSEQHALTITMTHTVSTDLVKAVILHGGQLQNDQYTQ